MYQPPCVHLFGLVIFAFLVLWMHVWAASNDLSFQPHYGSNWSPKSRYDARCSQHSRGLPTRCRVSKFSQCVSHPPSYNVYSQPIYSKSRLYLPFTTSPFSVPFLLTTNRDSRYWFESKLGWQHNAKNTFQLTHRHWHKKEKDQSTKATASLSVPFSFRTMILPLNFPRMPYFTH